MSEESGRTDRVELSEAEWRRRLDDETYRVLRQKGTEPAFSGRYCRTKEAGVYRCAGCAAELFDAETKFESGSGWPSFWQAVRPEAVELRSDHSHGMTRTEVLCARCGGHLGHVFPDGPEPTGERYCVNSISLELEPEAADAGED